MKANKNAVDIFGPCLQLAEILNSSPKSIERELVKQGEDLIGVFIDDRPTIRENKKFKSVQHYIIKQAIEDISKGLLLLRTATIGISNRGGDFVPYIAPHGSAPEGSVVFSINWKDAVAFKSYRENQPKMEVGQDAINAAVYKLTVTLSEALKS